VTFWNYDALNRVTVTGSGTLQYEYVYDTGGRRTAMRTRVNGVVTETTTYTYDLNDRLLTKVDPSGYTLTYTYDAVGNRSSLAVAPTGGGGAVLSQSYTYDTRNRVSTITGNGKTTTFTYDAVGRRTGVTWPNNSTATYTYDAAHQLLSLDHKTSGNADIATFYTAPVEESG
jgi:YD repeat-containing protein